MLKGKNKLLYLLGCPGDVSFCVFNKIKAGWQSIFCTENSSYGYNSNHDYQWKKEKDGIIINKNTTAHPFVSTDSVGEYDINRIPNHTGYDNYMIYWTLEGKKCKDYSGWAWRVRVISDDNKNIEKFINGIIFLDKWGDLCDSDSQ